MNNHTSKPLIDGTITQYVASGAIKVSDKLAELDAGAGALAMTLADGEIGQEITIRCTDGSTADCVVTPANLIDGATLTGDADEEYAVLKMVTGGWKILVNTMTLA